MQSAGDSLELILTDKLAGIENQYAKSDLGMGMPILYGSRLIIESLSNHIPLQEYQSLRKQYDTISKLFLKYQRDEELFQPFLDTLSDSEKAVLFAQITQLAGASCCTIT